MKDDALKPRDVVVLRCGKASAGGEISWIARFSDTHRLAGHVRRLTLDGHDSPFLIADHAERIPDGAPLWQITAVERAEPVYHERADTGWATIENERFHGFRLPDGRMVYPYHGQIAVATADSVTDFESDPGAPRDEARPVSPEEVSDAIAPRHGPLEGKIAPIGATHRVMNLLREHGIKVTEA